VTVSRRAFLAGGAATAVLAACGKKAAPVQAAELVSANVELAAGDRRLALAVFRSDRPVPLGQVPKATLRIGMPDGSTMRGIHPRSFKITRGAGGESAHEGEPDTIFVVEQGFDKPGFYELSMEVSDGGRRLVARGRVGVADDSATIGIGGKAVPVATPTVHDARGVDPICTRRPPCGMHEVSLDEALKQKRPVVAVFATPALCTSRMCGPVVDVLDSLRATRGRDAMFVHIEVYTDASGKDVTEGIKAWRLDQAGEPFVFFIGPDGMVRDRLSGPVGDWEADEALSRLL
jgi:hypothetical protein